MSLQNLPSNVQNSDILCERGEVADYNELCKKILQFFPKGNAKVAEWELLDNRYDSFFGATFGIPMSGREIDNEFNKRITIIADGLILNYCDILSDDDGYRYNANLRLDLVLKTVFPNAEINVIYSTKNRLQFVYDYITTKALETDYLIFNGVEQEFISSNSLSTVDNLVEAIASYCREKNITSICINTPIHREAITYCERVDIEYYKFDYYISLYEELCRVYGNDVAYNILSKSGYNTIAMINHSSNYDIEYNIRLDNSTVADSEFYQNVDFYCVPYEKRIYNLLIRYVMDKVFGKGLFEVYFSFMYQNITSDSYPHWLRDMNEYMSEEYDHSLYLKSIATKYGSTNRENPFRNSGEFVSFGLHTSYDMNLWMCEQGSITCNYEEDRQINDIKLLPAYEFRRGHPYRPLDLPYYPTTGCPWLTHSTEDMSNFHISSINKIVYYFTKHSHGGTITVRFHDSQDKQPDTWQSVHFGAEYIQDQDLHMFVAGGNQALSPDSWIYYRQSYVTGLSYDLSLQNISLSNSNLLTPTKLHDANLSNFRVFSKGKWRDYYKLIQDFKTVPYFVWSGPPPAYGVPLESPSSYSNTGMNLASLDTYTVEKELDVFKSSVILNRLYMCSVEQVDDKNPQVVYSAIKNTYSVNSLTLPEGINKLDSRYYLVMPNGWEDRLWWYTWYCGKIYLAPWQNREILDEMNIKYSELRQKKMQEKLVIDFSVDRICEDTNYIDVSSTVHGNTLLTLDIETAEDFDTLYFAGYKNLSSNYFTVIYNEINYASVSKEDSDNAYVKTFNSDGTRKVHIEVRVNDIVNDSIQISQYSVQYANIVAYFNKLRTDNKVEFIATQNILEDINLYNGVCFTKVDHIEYTDATNTEIKTIFYKLVDISKFKVTLGDIFTHITYTDFNRSYIYSYMYRRDIADNTLYIPYFDRYSNTARDYEEPKYFQFSTVIFGDGFTSNVNMRTEQAKIIYTPPTMNIIDFNSFDSNGCELFVYSNSRLKLVNLGVFNCIRGSDRTSMIKEGIEGGYFKSKLKIHLRKCIYDYAMIDYPEFSELFISDIV